MIRTGVDALVREGTSMLKVVQAEPQPQEHGPVAVGGALLDELVRDGARAMLAAALQAEVAALMPLAESPQGCSSKVPTRVRCSG